MRLRVDSQRQTKFAADLKNLDTGLPATATGSAPADPYTMDRDSKKGLAGDFKQYGSGGAGAVVVSADDTFQYRLASYPSLFLDPNIPADVPFEMLRADPQVLVFGRHCARGMFAREHDGKATVWVENRNRSMCTHQNFPIVQFYNCVDK